MEEFNGRKYKEATREKTIKINKDILNLLKKYEKYYDNKPQN